MGLEFIIFILALIIDFVLCFGSLFVILMILNIKIFKEKKLHYVFVILISLLVGTLPIIYLFSPIYRFVKGSRGEKGPSVSYEENISRSIVGKWEFDPEYTKDYAKNQPENNLKRIMWKCMNPNKNIEFKVDGSYQDNYEYGSYKIAERKGNEIKVNFTLYNKEQQKIKRDPSRKNTYTIEMILINEKYIAEKFNGKT